MHTSESGTPTEQVPAVAGVDSSRPFGAHLRMGWWNPLVVIIVPALVMVVLQVVFYQVVGVVWMRERRTSVRDWPTCST